MATRALPARTVCCLPRSFAIHQFSIAYRSPRKCTRRWPNAEDSGGRIACALRQAEADTPAADVCRGVGISGATFHVERRTPGWAYARTAEAAQSGERAPEAPRGPSLLVREGIALVSREIGFNRRARRFARPRSSQTGKLHHSVGHEPGVISEIAAPQAPRLLSQPEEPLQPNGTHPRRCPPHYACMKIEGCAHTNHDRAHVPTVLPHPSLLPRASKADEDQPRPRCVDGLDNSSVFLGVQGPKGGRMSSGDSQFREGSPQLLAKPGEGVLGAAVQEDRIAPTCCFGAISPHQFRAIDACLPLRSQATQHPDNRHPVGRSHVGLGENLAEP